MGLATYALLMFELIDKLGISDLNVHHMSSNCIKNVVLDRFVSVTVMG